MPYCDECEKYWTPSSVNADGTCRRCGAQLEGPEGHDGQTALDAATDDPGDEKVPWHFKLMIVALVVYLGWRFAQLGAAIFG